ncbi:MAG: prolipoprotein diacylglyceryl transferase [Candidatus Omnitrophota bacterium]|nr:prolipoprotein diacylglyceryl transferase [Candidatus Omnitrophota bacterium]MBU1929702.1 prolipoprotein diacylglyceryl transferase [Candidatus Omnitrophota bacterium]MBU2035100.1 prolipoprotein diacylglyceryl transferase [Candidatus Omnitrophota bacterium]MBU2221257.1 prolipoprotein diacylglyceryl transferase [Candidatus Omnitrophota bacterium]MBU2257981.1 prolipoprotein diacylglyceryl transferase [Candidatus Omnitrophota bacterium]
MLRILFNLGPINIYSYGLMLALAFLSGMYLIEKRARKQGLNKNKILDLVFLILFSAILGARALFVILNWDYYRSDLIGILKVWEGGLVFYGGLILAFFASVWFLKKNKLSFWKTADILSPALALGEVFGRIGCFLNGCCYGLISEKWGISFPARDNPPAFSQQVFDGLISPAARCSLPVIPTQIYSALAGLAIFCILLVLEKKKSFDGFLFWVFILLYSLFRFVIESFRYYEKNFFVLNNLTISQVISIVLVIISLVFLVKGKKQAENR